MPDPNVTFDAEKHEYRMDGVPVPSVTQVLRPLAGDAEQWAWRSEAGVQARQIGSAVAKVCEWDDFPDRFEGGYRPDPQLVPYFDAWRRFKSQSQCTVLDAERIVSHPLLRYCGTLDYLIEWKDEVWLIDVKTGQHRPWHAIQTTGYRLALGDAARQHRRACLHLTPESDPPYRLHQHDDPADAAVFQSLLTLHNWRARHGK